MANRAAAPLQEPAHDREAAVLEIEERQHFAHCRAIEQLRIDAADAHGIAAPRERVALRIRVIEIEDAALRDHRVEIEVLLEAFPELERLLVEGRIARQQV